MAASKQQTYLVTVLLTALTLVAFATNSVLCRLALGNGAIDAGSFTVVRLASGALMLWLLIGLSRGRAVFGNGGNWTSALMLFLYAIAFSFAYISLNTGTGALILFGSVQITMIVSGLRAGERLHHVQWLGFALATGGLVYLVSPGLTAPSPGGSLLMAIAGMAWGVYSLRGRGVRDPAAATTDNFVRSVPFVAVVPVLMLPHLHFSQQGLLLAIFSGAIASALGYIIWYTALRGLTATRAAIVQLAVPVLAALGGVVVLAEEITLRLVIAALATLGGVAIVVVSRDAATAVAKVGSNETR